jgi:hypothetical protein
VLSVNDGRPEVGDLRRERFLGKASSKEGFLAALSFGVSVDLFDLGFLSVFTAFFGRG